MGKADFKREISIFCLLIAVLGIHVSWLLVSFETQARPNIHHFQHLWLLKRFLLVCTFRSAMPLD